jgi:peptide deformylase
MEVVKAPDPKLRIKTKPIKKVTPAVIETLKQMIKTTKTFKDPEGVGLAATQVGLTERFFVAKVDKKDGEFMMVINPKILSLGKKTKKYFEGCLSTPNIWGEVNRSLTIKVEYLDEKGNLTKKSISGILAWIFQHEVDHLDGILFQDRVLEQKGKFYRFTGKDNTDRDTFEEIALP